MQLLFEESSENGLSLGLNLLKGKVDRFKLTKGFSIPQIQWNMLIKKNDCTLMAGIPDKEYFYYVNSYCIDSLSLEKNYKMYVSKYANQVFLGLIEHENIMGVQFHPEKSAKTGLLLMKNFIGK